ncbi:hypothetical protein TRFO_33233 [Tritrichomonas foetus]|uniref:Uncharacterized protein n=1 Tax=Tritrichomonas foetus TaxID=1144522 RepID=A0A1J4JRK4_9EUKA|nr:hypothetical protein TRFO_33233 [Tritrichomonas foetus]|eukprot:OHT00158.1 hypothetical protein TRFO_33233 [Tritrichomonas foetus]
MNKTTKKILIDPHAYTIDELSKRVSKKLNEEFNKTILALKSLAEKAQKQPVFFFIDSRGGGDEAYKLYLKNIINKVNSILASMSTSCITINQPNGNNEEMSDYLKMIRKGQLISFDSQTPDILLGMRDCSITIKNELNKCSSQSYQKAKEMLFLTWRDDHQMILSQYEKDSLFLMSLANPNESFDSYMYSVSEIVILMMKSAEKHMSKYEKYDFKNFPIIINHSILLNDYLFNQRYNDLKELIENNAQISEGISQEKLCNLFIGVCRSVINESLKRNNNDEGFQDETNEIVNELCYCIKCLLNVYLILFLADTNLPFNDCYQLSYDISSMTQSYLSFIRSQWVNELNLVHEYATLNKNHYQIHNENLIL